jgi:hypothetical protein
VGVELDQLGVVVRELPGGGEFAVNLIEALLDFRQIFFVGGEAVAASRELGAGDGIVQGAAEFGLGDELGAHLVGAVAHGAHREGGETAKECREENEGGETAADFLTNVEVFHGEGRRTGRSWGKIRGGFRLDLWRGRSVRRRP